MRHLFRFRPILAALALAAPMAMVAVDADARIGRGSGFGSRGSRTFQAPAPTQVAPRPGTVDRTIQQPGQQPGMQQPGAATRAPAATPTQAARPGLFGGMFGGGFAGGLMMGLLGAGLFGLLSGSGLFGGLGGFASILGLLLQIAIVFFVVRWVIRMFQRRSEPAYAGAPAGAGAGPMPRMPAPAPAADSAESVPASGYTLGSGKVALTQADFDTFERLLTEVQLAYGRQDLATVRRYVTPELANYMAEDIEADASKGTVNRMSDIKLLDGDLSESWREGDTDYATVAMRYSIDDALYDARTGAVLDRNPPEATEFWTFLRKRGGTWTLTEVRPVEA